MRLGGPPKGVCECTQRRRCTALSWFCERLASNSLLSLVAGSGSLSVFEKRAGRAWCI